MLGLRPSLQDWWRIKQTGISRGVGTPVLPSLAEDQRLGLRRRKPEDHKSEPLGSSQHGAMVDPEGESVKKKQVAFSAKRRQILLFFDFGRIVEIRRSH
jgi:hypothetical protein